jgi:hypothetical protein
LHEFFCNAGFNVALVCDGNSCHHSKKATTKRVAYSYNDKISFTKNKNKILHVFTIAKNENQSKNNVEKTKLKELCKKEK